MAHNMTRRSALTFGVSALGLALVPTQVFAGPLDRYSDEQVLEWLEDELDDLFDDFDEAKFYPDNVLENAVMAMLSDNPPHASAKHQAAHQYVTQAALEAEMREAGTTLRAVVHAAVLRADAMASLRAPRARMITAAWQDERKAEGQVSRPGLLLAQFNPDGLTKAANLRSTVGPAIVATKSRVRGN